MKKFVQLVILLFAACAGAHAQVAPTATVGPASLGYSFNYAQTSEFGSGLSDWQTIVATGRIDYRNGLRRLPFMLGYSGGYTWTIAGPPYSTGYYQHLLASQGFVWRKSSITFSDNVSYTPQAALNGFPGLPGVTPPPDQSVLTLKTRAVNNFVSANFLEKLTAGTTLNASGGWGLMRFPDGNGINIDSKDVSAGVTQRLSARNSLIGSYAFSQFSYPDYSLTLTSNTLYFGFNRNWNRKLTTGVSGGPQWISGSNSALVPPSQNFAINADLRYRLRTLSAGLIYTRGVSGGAGYLLGANADIVGVNASRELGRSLSIGVQGTYRRIQGLNHNGVISSEDFAVQANKRISRHLTAFAGYTIINQGSTTALPGNVLTNVLQSASFGFSYSRRDSQFVR